MTVKKLNVPGPKAQALLARDAATISPSYPRDYPFVMDHGLGSEVWDVDGNRYIDWAAGIAVCATGHSHPEVVKAKFYDDYGDAVIDHRENPVFAQAVPREDVAAILVEPIQGEGGYIVPT